MQNGNAAVGGSSTQDPLYGRRRPGSPTPDNNNVSKKARYSPSSSRPTTSNGMPPPLKPLSLSILGVEPLDEFIKEVADFIHNRIATRPPDLEGQIEVEAKLGVLKYRDADVRVAFPVRSETIIASDDHRFESNMTAIQHKHFNTQLNSLEAASRQPEHPTSPIRYQHSYLIDSFHPADGSDKIRVTRDEKTGEVKECMKKIRLGSLDIFSPKNNADWRVSVNYEVPVAHPLGNATFTRRKDRMSYSHEEFLIDLTQVTQSSGPGSQQIMHELEVEFARPSVLMSTAAVRGDPNVSPHERDAFDELVRAFVNNVRILVRNTRPAQ
ncbi:CET1 [Sanghuangporus vaninii]